MPRYELLRTRARFLAECGWGAEQELLSSLEQRDRSCSTRSAISSTWCSGSSTTSDQLQLLDALALADSEDGAPELIVIGRSPVNRRSPVSAN